MTGLIDELIRDASDDTKSVPQLLRRMKIAAVRLRLPDLEAWVDHELNGYPDNEKLPEYRALGGVPMCHHVIHGWRMMALGQNQAFNKAFQINLYSQSVVEAENNAKSTGTHFFTYPSFLESATVPQMHGVDRIAMSIDQGKFTDLLNGVRNRILDWALEMEKADVTGEGMSFTPAEQKAAQGMTNIFTGANARINQHSTDNSSNIVNNGNLFGDLKSSIEQGVSDEAQRKALVAAIADMEAKQGNVGFAGAYGRFIGLAANHMQIVQPFLEGLTGMLVG